MLATTFRRFLVRVSEMRGKRLRSAFQLLEHPFDALLISMGDVLKSEPEMVTGRLQPGRSIDQEDRVVDEMVLAEFFEEHLGDGGGPGRIERDVEQAVGGGIDSGVQPESVVVDLDHSLVDRDVIRVSALSGL